MIIRPTFDQAGLALLAVVGSAAGWAAMGICNKRLTRTDTTEQIVALNLLMVLPFSFALALLDWQWPSLAMWALGAAHGALGTIAHVCMARAFRHADASFCMPFDFTRLPFAAAIAYMLFGQLPDVWTTVGAAVIFSATLYVTLRERQNEEFSAQADLAPVCAGPDRDQVESPRRGAEKASAARGACSSGGA